MGKKNILVLGSGGREHALAWKLKQSPRVRNVYCAPGNAGTSFDAINVPLDPNNFSSVTNFVHDNNIGLTVVGPEDPLVNNGGIVDAFNRLCFPENSHHIFGPTQAGAMLEGSKVFAKEVMITAGIPTAPYAGFSRENQGDAIAYLREQWKNRGYVIKADGLALGKGVIVPKDLTEAIQAVRDLTDQTKFGDAGKTILLEERLEGEEASIIALFDTKTGAYQLFPASQDHKKVFDHDRGPNTGGMGAYAPTRLITPDIESRIRSEIFDKLMHELVKRRITYQGALYAGIMVTKQGPQVLEINARFGDPETQPLMMLLDPTVDLYYAMMSCLTGNLNQVEIKNKPGSALTVVMTSGGYPGKYEKGRPISGLNRSIPGVKFFHAGTKIQEPGIIVTNGGRVLGVTAHSPNGILDANELAYKAVLQLGFQGVQYRTDIGVKEIGRTPN